MEKCNNNFHAIVEWGGGPVGAKGDNGDPGVPTKPKVPIHVWRIGDKFEYLKETPTDDGGFVIDEWNEDLSDVKYQEGHLIMLENAHVYILEAETDYKLKPKFIIALQSYNAGDVVDGKNAYIHIAYANAPNSYDGFITDQQLRGDSYDTEDVSTFSITRSISDTEGNVSNMPYMGVYSDNNQKSSVNPNLYTWMRIQGNSGAIGEKGEKGDKGDKGERGEKGEKGDKGDSFTGQPYVIDLEGDMSTISLNEDRTRLYDDSGDYCECTLHAYYGSKNVIVNTREITIGLQDSFRFLEDGQTIVKKSDGGQVGKIVKNQRGNDVVIKFIPDETFAFPKTTIVFKIHVSTAVFDEDDYNTYSFVRDTVWMIKGIVSDFELEIIPQYRSIKLFEDGEYYPDKLSVTVYKIKDGERTVFNNINDGKSKFTLLYKNLDDTVWTVYPDYGVPNSGINTEGVSCLQFKIVKYSDPSESETPEEEIWDYEDVWVVSDGKGAHYYHADLGTTESMMVLTTGETGENIGTEDSPIYCAELRNENGYSIYLKPKFFDGSEELEITEVNIAPNSGDEYYLNGEGTFQRYLETIECGDSDSGDSDVVNGKKYKFTITSVPYGVDMIPMNFDVRAKCPIYNEFGNLIEEIEKNDSVSFMVYISTLSNTYSLRPTPTTFNTSTSKDGATISCSVYKNNVLIPTREEWIANGLLLEYVVYDSNQIERSRKEYDEPIIYGDDNDNKNDEFNAKDVAIEFILSYRGTDIVRSTVPLVKDGIDGRDGDSWQYIFCRSPKYPFGDTGFSNPYTWINDPEPNNSEHEYFGENDEKYTEGEWYDDHKGIDSEYRYEYQSYRKWDKINKCWGKYGEPTLYSNYSESGSSYSVLLSNPIAIIPVGNDWSTDEGLETQYDSTLIYIYNNTTDISTNPNVSISLPADNEYVKKGIFKITTENNINKVTFTPRESNGSIFTFEPNSQYKLPITVTYILGGDSDSKMDGDVVVDNFSTTINWLLSPIRGLEDVEVFVDKQTVNISNSAYHSLNVGYYLKDSNGSKKFIESPKPNEGNTKNFKIILTYDIGNLTNDVVVPENSWQNVEFNFVDNGEIRNCYVVLADNENNIIDYTIVTPVSNGVDGKSAMHLELTQDYITLPSFVENGVYKVHPDYNVDENPIHSKMLLYNGHELVTDYKNIEYYFKVDGKDVSLILSTTNGVNNGGFDIPKEIINSDMNIECIARYNGVDFYKTLFIDLEETPYEMELNKNVLSRDVNYNRRIIDDNIIVRVKYWMNGNWHYTADGYVKATTTGGKENLNFEPAYGDKCERYLKIADSTLAGNAVDTEVRISYYYDSNHDGIDDELTYETIGIINNGMDSENWQYIYCRSSMYPFEKIETISNPSRWKDNKNNDPYYKLLGDNNTIDPNWYTSPKGVNSDDKYEYQTCRQWDKSNKCWSNYEEPSLRSNYSESGSGYSVLLSNPIATIPVGDDWRVNENNTNNTDSTLVYFYNNISEISSSENIEICLPDNDSIINTHFEIEKENNIHKIIFKPIVGKSIFTFKENAPYKLPITLKYIIGENDADNFSTTINWTLIPIKGLEDIEVFVDKPVVNTSSSITHSLKVGYYLSSSDGDKKFIENRNVGNSKGYEIILTNDITKISSLQKELDWTNATYTFVVHDKYINCYVVLVDSELNIIDYTVVTPVYNGVDGKSPIHLELSQDYISLPCDSDGKVHKDYTENIYFEALLYCGNTLIEDYDQIYFSFKINGEVPSEPHIRYITDSDNKFRGKFEVERNIINGDTNIECIAIDKQYPNTIYRKTLFIDLEETPYELELNKSVLTRNIDANGGKITDEYLIVKVKYWMGGKWVYTKDGIVKATTNSGVNLTFTISSAPDNYERYIHIWNNNGLVNNSVDTEVRISFYMDNECSNELSYEVIGIINNGERGESTYCTGVSIIGYSLNENTDINDDNLWAESLNDIVENVTPGQTIYILNEYNWSVGEPTRVISTTLAGTQGVEGESRVLFYLGSFETGKSTLKNEYVIGKLTKERCDYYIDQNGIAWMRIGNDEIANGYSDGRKNRSSQWKQSDIVGFLQAGAITADMINVKNLVASDAFINNLKVTNANITEKLTADKIDATNLTVDAANITGTLTIGSDSENEGISLNGTLSSDNIGDGVITATKIQDGAIITGKIAAGAITAGNIQANAITVGKIATNAISANNIQAGAITADKIQANAITADKIQANAITADKIAAGAITADKIDTSKLSATEINTTPKSSDKIGRISILNNDIKVYSNKEEKIVLQITGDSFGDMSNIPNVEDKSLNITSYDTNTNVMFVDIRKTAKIGTFTVPNTGYNYNVNLKNNLSGNVIITAAANAGEHSAVYFGHADLYIVKKGETCPEFNESCGAWFTPLTITQSTTKKEYTKSISTGLYINPNLRTLPAGEYDLYIRHTFKEWLPWSTYEILCRATYSSQTLNFTLTPDVNSVQESLTCIASNGLRFVKSATEYFEVNGNGDLTYKCHSGNYVFTINNSGLRMKCGDTDMPQLAINHLGIEIYQKNDSGKRNGLKLDSLGYYMYIDDVKYKVTRDSSGYLKLT
jgi:hypothetical protein